MRDFEYLEAGSVHEASRMLAESGEESQLIAGGTALLIGMRQRILNPSHLISLGRLANLRSIEYDEHAGLRIGALACHAEIAESEVTRKRYPMLAAMACHVANPQVRNAGTIGGNLCYGDPSTDPPSCFMALGAKVILASTEGERMLDMEDFCIDYFQTAIQHAEVMTEIRVPPMPMNAVGTYSRFLRTAAEHRPLANIAILAVRSDHTCHENRIVVGASTVIPRRARTAEEYLRGKLVTPAAAEDVAERVAEEMQLISDSRGTAEYRRQMIRVLVRRSLCALFDQLQT